MSDHLHDYPLDSAQREIRLLTILPALTSDDPMKCSLQVASLDAFPTYEAISYVWGDIREKKDILLDGRTTQVPKNVRRILHRLRHRTQRRVLWVDYVCIDQKSVAEKNTQVPLMSAIYANATSVIAIISVDNLTDNAVDAIEWLGMSDVKVQKGKHADQWIKGVLSQISVGHERRLATSPRIIEFCKGFFMAEYWTRMWTFQEYRLSQGKPPICICGDVEFSVPGDRLHDATFMSMGHRLMDLAREEFEEGVPQALDHLKMVGYILRVCHALERNTTAENYKWVKDKQKFSVLDLLRQTSGRACHDERDKIYALYGLHPALQKAYPPDYNKPLSQIMFETAKYMLDEGSDRDYLASRDEMWPWPKDMRLDSLSLLDYFCLRKDRLENVSIPSWVPDLTTTLEVSTVTERVCYSDMLVLHPEIHHSSPRSYPKFTDDSSSVLCISGRPIGECRPVFQFASDIQGVLAQLQGVVQMKGNGCHVWDNVWESENIPHRFLQACSAFERYKYGVSTEEYKKSFLTNLHTAVKSLDLIHQDADTLLETLRKEECYTLTRLVPNLYGITVFTIHHTSLVGFGLSEQRVEEGDQVVVGVCQSDMPFVLRQGCDRDCHSGQAYHQLVGFAYVDGLCKRSTVPNPYLDHLCTLPYEELLLN